MKLTDFGFTDDFNYVYCRLCGLRIPKTHSTILLGTHVRYGWCYKWSHGVTVVKLMK